MADFFSSRVPVHKEDAAAYRRLADTTEAAARIPFESEMARLRMIASLKRAAESRKGPVDQEKSLQYGIKLADAVGMNGGTPQMETLLENVAWLNSEPDSRNVYMQASLIPEHAAMHAYEALSGDKPLSERAARLGMAIPASLFPEVGYPLQPAYERLYKKSPVAGLAADFLLMPDVSTAASALRRAGGAAGRVGSAMMYGRGVPTHLIDANGEIIRRLKNSPPASSMGGDLGDISDSVRQLIQKYPMQTGAAVSGGGLMYYGLSGDD